MADDFTKSDNPEPDFRWSAGSARAALDVANDELTDEKIADSAGVSRQTLWVWKKRPEFRAVVDEHRKEIRQRIREHGIAVVENRVRVLDTNWKKLLTVIEERANDPNLANVPGGKTGTVVHNVKGVGKGEDFQLIDLYEVDTGLLREIREHQKQAAQDLGQWAEKHEFNFSQMSDEDLIAAVTGHAGGSSAAGPENPTDAAPSSELP